MATRTNSRKKNLIARAVQLSRKRLSGDAGAVFANFLSTYYASVSPNDIRLMDAETLFAAGLVSAPGSPWLGRVLHGDRDRYRRHAFPC